MTKLIITTQPELEGIIEQILSKLISPIYGTPLPTDTVLTIDQASDYIKVPKGTIYQLTHRREIPFNKVGRSLRFRKMDLDGWLVDNKKVTKKEISEKLNLNRL